MMKYLVTFALEKEVELTQDFYECCANSCEDIFQKSINNIHFHSIIFKIDGNNKLSDKIKEVKETFLAGGAYIDCFQCIGITPITNDEIEKAIKNSFGNYEVKDEIEMDNHFDEIVKQLFSTNETITQVSVPNLNKMIDWAVAHIEFNHSYDELKEYLESKTSKIDKEFQEVYDNIIAVLLDEIYFLFYARCIMPKRNDINYCDIEHGLVKEVKFVW